MMLMPPLMMMMMLILLLLLLLLLMMMMMMMMITTMMIILMMLEMMMSDLPWGWLQLQWITVLCTMLLGMTSSTASAHRRPCCIRISSRFAIDRE